MTTKQWVDESELNFDFADLKQEAYDTLSLAIETDDSTDEAISAVLDIRGLRSMRGGRYKFDSEATRENFADAVAQGMKNFADEQAPLSE